MRIDFTVNCNNPGVVFAIAAALKAAGFKVDNAGIMIGTGEPDIECSPPIDFIDSVPDVLQPFVSGEPTSDGPPAGDIPLNSPPSGSGDTK